MAAPILYQNTGISAQRGVDIHHGARQTTVELGVGLAGIDLPQHHLGVRPGQLEHAIRQPLILIFFGQAQHCVARFSHADHHIDGGRLLRVEGDRIANSDDRIQHRALAPRKLARRACSSTQGLRVSGGAGAAYELHAARFIRDGVDARSVHCHQVHHPRHFLAGRARSACAQYRLARFDDLRLYK